MAVNMRNQLIRIFAHLKEIRLFLCRLYLPPAVGALSVFQLRLRPERFAGRAVKSFIGSLVNIPLLIKLFKDFLYLLFVIAIRCADKVVVGGIHQIPQPFNRSRNAVHKFLRRNSGVLGL